MLEFSNKEYKIIEDILNLELNNKKFNFANHNICLNKDEITGLIYKFKEEKEKNIEDKILEKISPLFSQEILTYIKYSGFFQKYEGDITSKKTLNKNFKLYIIIFYFIYYYYYYFFFLKKWMLLILKIVEKFFV